MFYLTAQGNLIIALVLAWLPSKDDITMPVDFIFFSLCNTTQAMFMLCLFFDYLQLERTLTKCTEGLPKPDFSKELETTLTMYLFVGLAFLAIFSVLALILLLVNLDSRAVGWACVLLSDLIGVLLVSLGSRNIYLLKNVLTF